MVGSLIAQLQMEGFRWQMLPLYVLAVGLAVGDILFIERELKWTNRVSRGVFGSIGLLLATSPAVLLPVPSLPVPIGGTPVGTYSIELVDHEREDVLAPREEEEEENGELPGFTDDDDEAIEVPRRFMAQVWYPAESPEGAAIEWSGDWDVVAPAMSRRLGFPGWFLNHTRYTMAHATGSPPIAPGTYPVVIYSHGWTGFRTIAVNQMEALASSGYVVIAIDHTYGAVATRFPDGEVVEYLPDALPSEEAVGYEAHMSAGETLIEAFADDIISVIDALELGPEGPFSSVATTVDLERIGVYGHSVGGGAAVQACLIDDRCGAVAGLDAWVEPLPIRILRETSTVPGLFMRSDGWRETPNDAILRGVAGRGESISYWVGVEGAGHNDFVLTPLVSPAAARFGLRGPISAGRIIPIINNYLVGFFDVFLLGTGSAALDTVRFDEVTVETLGQEAQSSGD